MFVDEVITTNPYNKVAPMNLKFEFESFLASKAEEFVSSKTNMTIAEFRELNDVLDTCGIDFSSLPKQVSLLKTKRINRVKSNISTQDVIKFILSSLTYNKCLTMKDMYAKIEDYFGDKLTSADTVKKTTTGMSNIKSRVYTQANNLVKNREAVKFQGTDGKVYFTYKKNISREEGLTL
jgi:hypothetical protein